MKKQIGRSSLLTKKVQDKLCYIIEKGNTYKCAFTMCGIAKSTFYKWLKQGEDVKEKLLEGEKITKKEKIHLDFIDAIKKANAEAENRNVTIINLAAQRTWQAAAWWLERRIPEDYAKRDNLTIKHFDATKFDVKLTKEEQEEYNKKLNGFYSTIKTKEEINNGS